MSIAFRWPTSKHGLTPRPTLKAGAVTRQGTHREQNQDFLLAEQEAGIFIVADGMGGHDGGAEASEFLSAVIAGELLETETDKVGNLKAAQAAFERGAKNAIKGMRELANGCPKLSTMGSTIVIGWFVNDDLYYAHAGDSRLYLLRNNKLKRLTKDHSITEELSAAGVLNASQCKHNRWRHCITRYIGPASPDSRLEVGQLSLRLNDRLLFITDGITDVLNDAAIRRAAQQAQSATELCDWLITAAHGADSRDDTTCVAVDYRFG